MPPIDMQREYPKTAIPVGQNGRKGFVKLCIFTQNKENLITILKYLETFEVFLKVSTTILTLSQAKRSIHPQPHYPVRLSTIDHRIVSPQT